MFLKAGPVTSIFKVAKKNIRPNKYDFCMGQLPLGQGQHREKIADFTIFPAQPRAGL
jgi:hypothetical protein